jgi:hypothetical protein
MKTIVAARPVCFWTTPAQHCTTLTITDCSNNAYQSFSIDRSTGELSYLGVTGSKAPKFEVPLTFIGNNKFAYGSDCYHFDHSIFGFERGHDRTLTDLNINPKIPVARKGDFYCPYLASADPTTHVAMSFQAINANTFNTDGPPQLATYTADSSGNLTTNSTRFNMPATAVNMVMDIWMSPSAKLLAVGGTAGLQIFHFNGSNPITHYTGLITRDEIDQFFWDNDNHLYAISRPAGKLYVFTVTPTSASQAPGSPYNVSGAADIIVLPKT